MRHEGQSIALQALPHGSWRMALLLSSAVILAIASPPGRSPRGIIRISGDETFALVSSHIARHSSLALRRGLCPTRLSLGGLHVPALVLSFPGPRSYTGEDAFESPSVEFFIIYDKYLRFAQGGPPATGGGMAKL